MVIGQQLLQKAREKVRAQAQKVQQAQAPPVEAKLKGRAPAAARRKMSWTTSGRSSGG